VKLISFSLWGTSPKYLVGAIRNAELAKEIYPDWICRFYIGSSVPYGYVHKLSSFDNTEIVERREFGDWTGMYWRFEPAAEDNIDAMISRDVDSRLNLREKAAVDEWLESDKGFHIMRDHPWHKYPILGGMWGCKKGTIPNMKALMDMWNKQDSYGTDYEFLAKAILPVIKDKVMVHDEFYEGNSFPTVRQGYDFVGQVFDENEQTVQEHLEALRLHVK
tara:strand:- start:1863 stop:2519 length:657 start_codon:yes stop_codon:yes gene_type:complete